MIKKKPNKRYAISLNEKQDAIFTSMMEKHLQSNPTAFVCMLMDIVRNPMPVTGTKGAEKKRVNDNDSVWPHPSGDPRAPLLNKNEVILWYQMHPLIDMPEDIFDSPSEV